MTNPKDPNGITGTNNHHNSSNLSNTQHNQNNSNNNSYSNTPNISQQKNEKTKEESVIFILRQIISLLKLSLQTSSKVIHPAIQPFLQAIVPTFVYYYEQLAPIRLQEWLQIYISALQNFFSILSQTPEGKQVLSQIHAVSSNTVHLLTSVHTRQLLVETVGVHVKALEALNTPQMKTFLSSLPVLFIRILDNVSSGDAKLLYHSLASLLQSILELLGKDGTILAFAEVTALLVNALERERQVRGPWNRKQSGNGSSSSRRRSRGGRSSRGNKRGGGVKLPWNYLQGRKGGTGSLGDGGGGGGSSSRTSAASNSKRRRERNKFIAETYTNRVLLNDKSGGWKGRHLEEEEEDEEDGWEGDVTVEDAILSSLGDGTTKSDNAWLTRLGRQDELSSGWLVDGHDGSKDDDDDDDGASSLPSRVVLPKMKSREKEQEEEEEKVSRESVVLDDLEVDSDMEGGGGGGGAVDISYLRKNIRSRREKKDDMSQQQQRGKDGIVMGPPELSEGVTTNHLSTESIAGSSLIFSEEEEQSNSQRSIEDLELSSVLEDGTNTTNIPVQESISRKIVELEHESDVEEEPFFKQSQEQQQQRQHTSPARGKGPKFDKGTYSSTAHFYRTLEEIQNRLRQKAVLQALNTVKDGLEDYPGVSTANNTTGKTWQSNAAAAAGAGNEQGQNLLRRRMTRGYSRMSSQPIRFRPRVEREDSEEIKHDESQKMALSVIVKSIFGALPVKRKLFIGGALAATAMVILVWFILGCYGLYYLVREIFSKGTVRVASGGPSTATEIVLRIVQDPGVDGTEHKEAISKAAADAIKNAIIGEL